jgi:hypothetical protein
MRNFLKAFLLVLTTAVGGLLTSCVAPGYTVVEHRPPVVVAPAPVIVAPALRPYYRPRYYRPAPRPYYGPRHYPAPRGRRVIVVR